MMNNEKSLSIENIYQKIDQNLINIGSNSLECEAFFNNLWETAVKKNADLNLINYIKKDYYLFTFRESIPLEDLEYYKERFKKTENPVLKVMYFKVLNKEKLDFALTLEAFDNFFILCESTLKSGNPVSIKQGIDILNSSLEYALKLKNENMISKSLSKHVEFITQYIQLKNFNWAYLLVKSLFIIGKKHWDKVDESFIENIIKEVMKEKENGPKYFNGWKDWSNLLIQLYTLLGKHEEKNKTLQTAADTLEQDFDEMVKKGELSHIKAGYYYNKIAEYRKKMNQSHRDMNDLMIKIKHHQKEGKKDMVVIKGSYEIPEKEIQKFVSRFEKKPTLEIIQLIYEIPIISFETCVQARKSGSSDSFLEQIPHITYVNGLIKAKTVGNETIDTQAKWFFIEEMKLLIFRIGIVFQKLGSQNDNFLDELNEFFGKNNNITSTNKQLISYGIEKFRKKEYIAAIHVLIFQVEVILRNRLKGFGISDYTEKNGIQQYLSLGSVLTKLRENHDLQEDFLIFLDLFLSDQQFVNLRNKIAHGLTKIEEFNENNTVALIFILIKLVNSNDSVLTTGK
ncbi:hypothetical protein LCGC14_0867460 [marine sediment metagenome]|uniref:DUF4209 domain-containing protein n=1 Tax=marine sediment metagenome TaxID=412755 RepID=A0A0F9SCN6_9ZZZZ